MDGKKFWQRAGLVVFALVILAVVLIVGWYQEEVLGYLRLQGWDLHPAEQATKEFIDAAAKGDGTAIARVVGPKSDQMDPIQSGSQVTGFNITEYGGAKPYTLKQLVPNASPKLGAAHLVLLNGGTVNVTASFPAHILDFRWDRTDQGWKLKGLSKTPADPSAR